MLRRALALLCLTRCAATPPAEAPPFGPGGGPPGAADRRPVPSASLATATAPVPSASLAPATAPVPSASLAPPAPLRQLHAGLRGFGVRDGGDLLVEPLPEWHGEGDDATWERAGLAVLDPTSGALRPFSTPWSPADLGWKLRRGSAPDLDQHQLSADGRWVALGYSFEPRRPPRYRPEVTAIVVARSDGSDPRCVGIGIPSDDPPRFDFTRGGALLGDWNLACAPDRHGALVPLRADGDIYTHEGALPRSYDPSTGVLGERPGLAVWGWSERDPLGDGVWSRDFEGDRQAVVFFDLARGAQLGRVLADDAHTQLLVSAWVSADSVLVDLLPDHAGRPSEPLAQRLVTADGRQFPAPHARWRVYTRLAGGEHLFSRDGGATVEQGRVDWPRFAVATSRRRPELDRFGRAPANDPWGLPTWTPGLGGVLIHEPTTGALHLAAI